MTPGILNLKEIKVTLALKCGSLILVLPATEDV